MPPPPAGTFGAIVDGIAVAIDFLVGVEPAVRIIGDDADVREW
jgi:hypothetical protein